MLSWQLWALAARQQLLLLALGQTGVPQGLLMLQAGWREGMQMPCRRCCRPSLVPL